MAHDAAIVLGSPIPVDIAGHPGAQLNPISFSILGDLSQRIVADRLASIPTVDAIIQGFDRLAVTPENAGTMRAIVADAVKTVAELAQAARRVEIGDCMDALASPEGLMTVYRRCLVGGDGKPLPDAVVSAYMLHCLRDRGRGEFQRWLEASGFADPVDPTASAT